MEDAVKRIARLYQVPPEEVVKTLYAGVRKRIKRRRSFQDVADWLIEQAPKHEWWRVAKGCW
jgi:hypothetical protein